MKALFGRTKKDAALQGGAGGAAAGPPAPDGGSRRPGPAVPFLHKSKAEPSPAAARPELAALQGPAGSAPGATGHLSRASGEIEPAENTTLAHGIAGPASGASMAKLNLENTGLREATAESTVGAGRLFARPTPAQLLKGNQSTKPSQGTVSPEAVPSKAKMQEKSSEIRPETLLSSISSVTALEAQKQELKQGASESMVGAGQVFKRPSPAQMLKGVSRPESAEALEDVPPPQPPKKSPAKAAKTTVKVPKAGESKKSEVAREDKKESGPVRSPQKATKKEPAKPTIHPDAVQIGRLDPIPEGDEECSSDNSDAEEKSEAVRPDVKFPTQGDRLDKSPQDASESFAGEPISVHTQPGSRSEHSSGSSTKAPKAAKAASSLQQLPLIKLERDTKPAVSTKQVPAPEHASLEEADAAREAEVLRIQEMANLPSASLPLELESALRRGITDHGHGISGKGKPLDDDVSDQDEEQDGNHVGARSTEWTDFARERAKALGQAVDDAEYRGAGKAKLKLNPGVNDVLLWLRNIGWGQYEETFAINQIDYDELFTLTDVDLQEMGMKIPSNRHMLLDAIAALKQVFTNERHGREMVEKTVEDKNIFIEGRDKREKDNSELIANQTYFEQKKGYITWSDHSGKKWKRGFAVIQGGSLHIFKSSDHVVLKPLVTKQLQGSLILPSEQADNCLYIQTNTLKKSTDDVFLCGPDEQERDAWMQHLVAAASLQLLQHVRMRNVKTSLPSIMVILDEIYINKTGPYALPRLEIKLMDKVGSIKSTFDDATFPDGDEVVQPSAKGSIAQTFGQQMMLSKKLRQEAGPGSIMFFEFKHTIKEKSGESRELTQYWAYAFVDDLKTGNVKLDLMKKPAVYDPMLLHKGSLPKKDKSFVGLTVHLKDAKTDVSAPSSVKECSRALLDAIRSKVSSTDQDVLSSMESLESMLEALQILDGPDSVSIDAWEAIASGVSKSGTALVHAEKEFEAEEVQNYRKRIAELEAQLEQQSLSPNVQSRTQEGDDTAVEAPGDQLSQATPVQQWSHPERVLQSELTSAAPLPPSETSVVSKYVKLVTSEYPGPAPSVCMRPFHWKKVPASESLETIWTKAKLEEWKDVVALLDPHKIEVLFSASQTFKTGGDMPLQVKSMRQTALIDLRRAQQVSIMLSKFRCTFTEVKDAVMNLDASVLDIEKTADLISFVPFDEEMEVLKAYAGDIARLGLAERFFLEISGVPRYKERLQVHQLIMTYDDRCMELAEKLSSLIKCLTELTKSKRLRRFMLHILAIGNFMNHGTSMGNAPSFRLDALNEAVNIRSNVEGVTLLHFLASHVQNKDPDLLNLPSDLAHAETGAALSLTSMSELVAGLEQEKVIVVQEHEKCALKDPLRKILSEFMPHMNMPLESVSKQLSKCQALVKEVKALFAETRPSVTQEDFCSTFANFKTALVSVIRDNEKARAKLASRADGNESFDTLLDQTRDDESFDITLDQSQSSQAGMSPQRLETAARSDQPDASRQAASAAPLDNWLSENQLAAHAQALRFNLVTLDGLCELSETDMQDLGVMGSDRDRMVKAISKLKRERNRSGAAAERVRPSEAHVPAEALSVAHPPAMPPRSRTPALPPGPLVWGVCYGEAGEAKRGQQHGWVEIQNRSKSQAAGRWEKFYAKRARNTLVLFTSEADLSSPVRKVCLDGVIVHRSDDRRQFVVEVRKSIFQETKDDLFLAADSKKEAASWEKALVKGSMWHAENKNPSSSSSSSSSSTSAPASTGGRGLTPAEVETVGQTFTYKGKRPVAPQDNGVGVGMLETTRPHDRTMATQAQTHKQALLSLTFVKLESPSGDGPLERLSLALTTSATVDGKVMLEPIADVDIPGLPAQEKEIIIGLTRALPIPFLFNSASDLCLCIEVRHHEGEDARTRAWTNLPLADISGGARRLQLYATPVQLGLQQRNFVPIEGCFLTLDLRGSQTA